MKKIILLISLLTIFLSANAYSYGKNKIQNMKTNWKVIETRHFDIHYANDDDQFGETIAYIAENAFYHLNSYFKTPLAKRIPIIIYQSKQQFQTTNIIYPLLSEGVGGFTESLRNRVVVPFDGSYKKFEEVLIHELTHAYINDISGNFIINPLFESSINSLPFWFSEGLPEYLSIGGVDTYNNMFILDLVLNDRLYPLDKIYGYYAYRLGEAFLAWLAIEFGEEIPAKFFYQIRVSPDLDSACKKLFGQKFEDIEKRFRLYLKRKYYPVIQNYANPSEKTEQLTNVEKFKANMNLSPRISPLNDKIVFFSNKLSRTGIWEISPYDEKKKPKNIMTGELDGRFEEFHFQRSNISWFPNGKEIAFVSKTSVGDHIYIYNTKSKKIKNRLFFKQMDSIYELDVDKKGERIVFSGQENNQNNIYIYNLQTKTLEKITSDYYEDSQPKWSHQGNKIAFTSERNLKNTSKYNHVFSKLNKNIFIYDLDKKSYFQVTFDDFNNQFPVWRSNDEEILFVSEENNVSNMKVINISNNTGAYLDKYYSGVYEADLSLDDDMLVFSCFNNSAWDIHMLNKPFNNLEYKPCQPITEFSFVNDFYERFNLKDYALFGKIPEDSLKTKDKPFKRTRYHQNRIEKDSLMYLRMSQIESSSKIEQKPDSTNYVSPLIRNYTPTLKIDSFWGGMAYSSSLGTIGQIQLGLSDLMGNHALGINTEFSGKLKDTNFIFSYLYLPYRIDYGLAVFKTSDDIIYYFSNEDLYRRLTEREFGLYFLFRYPLNKYFRIEYDQAIYEYQKDWDLWDETNGNWQDINLKKVLNYSPAFSIVYDNALYGSTGPVSGIKAYYTIKKNFSEKDFQYLTQYTDIRTYSALNENFSLANRFIFGHSQGANPQQFNLLGFNGVRGNESDHEGNIKALSSLELRYPFVDYLKLGFPLPMTLGDIRGSVFTDLGAVWDSKDKFQGFHHGKLQDLTLGFGFGPRMNIGYFVIKLDVAWKSDLINHGKPSYYFSINQDF